MPREYRELQITNYVHKSHDIVNEEITLSKLEIATWSRDLVNEGFACAHLPIPNATSRKNMCPTVQQPLHPVKVQGHSLRWLQV